METFSAEDRFADWNGKDPGVCDCYEEEGRIELKYWCGRLPPEPDGRRGKAGDLAFKIATTYSRLTDGEVAAVFKNGPIDLLWLEEVNYREPSLISFRGIGRDGNEAVVIRTTEEFDWALKAVRHMTPPRADGKPDDTGADY